MKTLDFDEARIAIVGAVIRQAIMDCYSDNLNLREDARDFIFTDRVYKFLKRFHFENSINVALIRRKVDLSRRDFFLHTEHYKDELEVSI